MRKVIQNSSFYKPVVMLLFLVAIARIVYAQPTEVVPDSISRLADDQKKVDQLVTLGKIYNNQLDSSSLFVAGLVEGLSRKIEYTAGIGDAFGLIGSFSNLVHRYERAITYLDSAIHYYQMAEDIKGLGTAYGKKGVVYIAQKKFDRAREFSQQAYENYKQAQDSIGMINCLINIGITYDQQGMYSNAMKYYFQCLEMDQQLDDQERVAYDYMLIAITYKKLKETDQAINYFEKALSVNRELGLDFSIGSILTNLGIAYKDDNQFEKALNTLNEALDIFTELENLQGKAYVTHNLGSVYYELGNLPQAEKFIDASAKFNKTYQDDLLGLANNLVLTRVMFQQQKLQEAVSLGRKVLAKATELNVLEEQHEATFLLSEIYEQLNRPEMALKMIRKGVIIKDSINNQEKTRQIQELDTRYQTAQKENQIELLSKESDLQESELSRKSLQQNMTLGGIGILLLTGLVGFRSYRSRQRQKEWLLDQQIKNEKQHSEKLRELDETKSRFFANIAHEFRTPLTLIQGPAEQIIDSNSRLSPQENAALIHQHVRNLLNLTNQLLDLSKLETGMIKLQPENKDLVQFCQGSLHAFESLADQKDIKLEFQTKSKELRVDFDTEKMGIILNNLISNAIKFTEPFGKVTLQLTAGDEEVSLEIKDTGIGIPVSHLDHIFDRFYQVDDSHTRKNAGSGIGLALTKELVELHQGRISVKSKPGEGTVFFVSLPYHQELKQALVGDQLQSNSGLSSDTSEILTKEVTIQALEHTKTSSDEDRPVLLLVEDNPEVRNFMADILTSLYRVIEAENGKIGLILALEHVPDLVISDVMMPEMDGYDLCRQLKVDERTSHIPVILLTAKAGLDSKLEGLETGADDYLAKPFNARELQARIKNLISLRQKLQQKYRQTQDTELFPEQENAFLTRLKQVIDQNIDKEDFNMEVLSLEIGMSRTQIHRKLKALTNLSTSIFIRQYKLEKAIVILKKKEQNVSEVAYMLGFNTPAYFSSCFAEHFGFPPGDLLKGKEV